MFSNKKNSLPPRPHVPSHEHMLEDLEKAVVDDVAFKIANDLHMREFYGPTSINNSDDIYKKIKTYLNTNQQLKQLECTLRKEEQQMQENSEEIKRLQENIKKQAEAALLPYLP